MIATLVAYDMLVGRGLNRSNLRAAVHLPAVRVANPRAPRAAPPPVRAGGPRERNHGRLAARARYTSIPAAPNSVVRWAVASGPALSPWGSPLCSPFWRSILLEMWRTFRERPTSLAARLLFFGPLWWAIQTAPLMVTYSAGRHLYLASGGPVIVLALCLDGLFRASSTRRRLIASGSRFPRRSSRSGEGLASRRGVEPVRSS